MTKIRVYQNPATGGYGLVITRKNGGNVECLSNEGWIAFTPESMNVPTLLWFAEDNPAPLRELAATLHELGLTPATSAIGELKATKAHLEDLRALVFKTGKP